MRERRDVIGSTCTLERYAVVHRAGEQAQYGATRLARILGEAAGALSFVLLV